MRDLGAETAQDPKLAKTDVNGFSKPMICAGTQLQQSAPSSSCMEV